MMQSRGQQAGRSAKSQARGPPAETLCAIPALKGKEFRIIPINQGLHTSGLCLSNRLAADTL